jgi:hypothetical protein
MRGYWLNHYFPKILRDSMLQVPSPETVAQAMTSSGLKITATDTYRVKPDLQDQLLYYGKQNPELYFDNSICHGISSINALDNKTEVKNALVALRSHIDNGKIDEIIASYQNDLGDYLYVIGENKKN